MKSKEEIIENLKSAKTDLMENCNINEIGIFGSYSRNEQTESSDIDILVEFSKNIGLIQLMQIENYIKNLVGENADVVIKSDIRPELKDEILKETIFI